MMTATLTGADDSDDHKPHPENASTCARCHDARHDECRDKKCGCGCRGPARTPKHDWLDPRFDDEIDLERAMAESPSMRLVIAAMYAGAVTVEAKDVPWFYVGKFQTSPRRPSTTDARWGLTCRRCQTKLTTTRLVIESTPPQKITWLRKQDVVLPEVPERVYRVGRCGGCAAIYWFELGVKK